METQVTEGEANFNHTQWRMIEKKCLLESLLQIFSLLDLKPGYAYARHTGNICGSEAKRKGFYVNLLESSTLPLVVPKNKTSLGFYVHCT